MCARHYDVIQGERRRYTSAAAGQANTLPRVRPTRVLGKRLPTTTRIVRRRRRRRGRTRRWSIRVSSWPRSSRSLILDCTGSSEGGKVEKRKEEGGRKEGEEGREQEKSTDFSLPRPHLQEIWSDLGSSEIRQVCTRVKESERRGGGVGGIVRVCATTLTHISRSRRPCVCMQDVCGTRIDN